jgi:hypothetical protein
MKFQKLPSSDRIDSIITDYNISGMAKISLLELKEALLSNLSGKKGILVEMDIEAFKSLQNGFKTNSELKAEIERFKKMSIFQFLKYKW